MQVMLGMEPAQLGDKVELIQLFLIIIKLIRTYIIDLDIIMGHIRVVLYIQLIIAQLMGK